MAHIPGLSSQKFLKEEESDEELFDLPGKVHSIDLYRNIEISGGKLRTVLVNGYKLDLRGAVKEVFKHQLIFEGTFEYKKKDGMELKKKKKDLSKGLKNDVASNNKRLVLWEFYRILLRSYPNLFGPDAERNGGYVYDCGNNFYAKQPLLKEDHKDCLQIDFSLLPDEVRPYLGRRIQSVNAEMLGCEVIRLQSKEAITETRDRSVIQFLEILTSQKMTQERRYFAFGNKMFKKDSVISLDRDPRLLKEGMQKNVRFVGDNQANSQPIVQLDDKKTAFFPEMPLIQFLEEFFLARDLKQSILQNISQAKLILKGLTVETTHLREVQRMFSISGLTAESAERITINVEGRRSSVADYYHHTYILNLRYGALPCATESLYLGGKTTENYYPLEVLKIVGGQRVPVEKQRMRSITDQIIRISQNQPVNFLRNIETQKGNAMLNNNNRYIRAYNIRVDTEILTADAETLCPPCIAYSETDKVEPASDGRLEWKMRPGRRFVVPANPPKQWAIVTFQSEIAFGTCETFTQAVVNTAKNWGLDIGLPQYSQNFVSKEIDFIREKFEDARRTDVEYMMYFTKNKKDYIHNTMKLMEKEYKIVTQNVTLPVLLKAIGGQGKGPSALVVGNIVLKLNLKLGGINHSLVTSTEFSRRNRCDDLVNTQWIRNSSMFLGLDMSHGPAQSLYERQAKIPSSVPTVVGMAYTVGHPVSIRGTYWMQEPRVTYVQELKGSVKRAMENYFSHCGQYPKHVFVFRGGVSEGEYSRVVRKEQQQFALAFEEMHQKEPLFDKPDLTIIVVQRSSNYRIVPSNAPSMRQGTPAHEQNVPSGTCVNRGVMHPAFTEFLLVAHKTIQGTANPARCTVVWDDTSTGRIPIEDLQYISYNLCYAHGIVTSPISVPAPLYSASDLAKRGRNNWRAANYEGAEYASGKGKYSVDEEDNANHFFIEMSDLLQPTISDKKFWA